MAADPLAVFAEALALLEMTVRAAEGYSVPYGYLTRLANVRAALPGAIAEATEDHAKAEAWGTAVQFGADTLAPEAEPAYQEGYCDALWDFLRKLACPGFTKDGLATGERQGGET